MHIYIDADACPVKDEAREGGRAPRHRDHVCLERLDASAGKRACAPRHRARRSGRSGDWIADRIGAGDICVTQDIPLAGRCLKKGARAIGNTGKPFTDASIGMALAMRELSQHLRETGESKGLQRRLHAPRPVAVSGSDGTRGASD